MDRTAVKSSQIASVGYDQTKQVLEVEFKRGNAVYQYESVPKSIHAGLLSAESPGKYFGAFVREKFPFRKLGGEHAEGKEEASSKETAKETAKETTAAADTSTRQD
jgi:hypothetical protein